MAGNRGSFGVIGYQYEILPDRVTIWRPAKLGPVLALFIIPAIIGWTQAFSHNFKRMDSTWFVIAVACSAIFVIGMFMFPVFGVKKVVVTREGVEVDGKKIPAQDFTTVISRTRNITYRNGGYQSWGIMLSRREKGKFIDLDFGNRQLSANPEQVRSVAAAAAALLGKPLK
jgi:hypothetical protein